MSDVVARLRRILRRLLHIVGVSMQDHRHWLAYSILKDLKEQAQSDKEILDDLNLLSHCFKVLVEENTKLLESRIVDT